MWGVRYGSMLSSYVPIQCLPFLSSLINKKKKKKTEVKRSHRRLETDGVIAYGRLNQSKSQPLYPEHARKPDEHMINMSGMRMHWYGWIV